MCLLVLSGCAHDEVLPDLGLLPAGYSVVLAAPASRFLPTRSMLFGHARDVPEPVGFRFRRVGRPDEPPAYLELIGASDQSVRLYAAPPGTYRLVEAYLLSQPWKRRWSFAQSPDVLEVREGEAVYVGTLLWRDYWVDVVNDEPEARAIYDKRIQEFKSRSLRFVTRLVRTTEYGR
jgi:hypothetical protein